MTETASRMARNCKRWILLLPRPIKRLIATSSDIVTVLLASEVAFYLRLGEWQSFGWPLAVASMIGIIIMLPIFIRMGLYRAIFRFAGWHSFVTIMQAMAIYTVIYATIFALMALPGIPRTVGLIQPALLFLMVGISRVLIRYWLGDLYAMIRRKPRLRPVLIYGASADGQQLFQAANASRDMQVIGFIDDDKALIGGVIEGRPIYGRDQMPEIIDRYDVTDLLLAPSAVSRAERATIASELRQYAVQVRTLPAMSDVASGTVRVSDLHELQIEDLLGRDPVEPIARLMATHVAGHAVMVTGAGGSIGSELCRQILTQRPTLIVLVDISESALYQIDLELRRLCQSEHGEPDLDLVIVPLIASVADEARMRRILRHYRPNIIFHAAAYKHVPLVEHNIVEGVRNNVIGTLVTASLARELAVRNFVLISTDKAVRPTNVMGATKRLSEMILQAMHAEGSRTTFSMVRFGNVLGSSGSVVPLFRSQIANGDHVTITHPDITRYFMTITEAAQLVVQAAGMATGGDVFLLDMGEPVRIADLARNMIEMSGMTVRDEANPAGDIEIRCTGLRPGEKLYEELLIGSNPVNTEHERIMRASENFVPMKRLQAQLIDLAAAIERGDPEQVHGLLRNIVPEFSPNSPLVDLSICDEDIRQTA